MGIKLSHRTGKTLGAATLLFLVAGCSDANEDAAETVAFPESLVPVDGGYPNAGDPCRSLGPSEAIMNWVDDYPELVGCPSGQDARGLQGKSVGIVDGFFIVAVGEAAFPNSSEEENGSEVSDR